MIHCFKCNRNSEEIRLFDGIYISEAVKVCEKCALLEGIPILKLPSTDQLKSSEKKDHIYKRLQKISGLGPETRQKSVYEELHDLETNPNLTKPDQNPIKLVEDFHWKIQHERRHKGLTHKQLADQIGESEMAIRLIERNNLPENSISVIKKLEQYLRIKLLRDEARDGKFIPRLGVNREETLMRQPEKLQKIMRPGDEPIQVLNFKPNKLRAVTISDLKEMQRVVEQDFPKKTSEEIGKEQLENFGKEGQDSSLPLSSWSREFLNKRLDKKGIPKTESQQEKTPSIHELAERRRVQEHKSSNESMTGADIDILED